MGVKQKARKLAGKVIKRALPPSVVKEISEKRLQESERRKNERLTPGTYKPNNRFTVVTAVYNTGAYLDDFFESLKNQTIDGSAIHVITVDDGSTDKSPDIIARWQEKWPNHITYIRKENGGQASARNVGLEHVDTEWVTFIDPDDFVARDYFELVDKSIVANPSLKMVACNFIFYIESKDEFSDTHSLNARFEHGDSYFAVGDEQMHIQFHMSSAFFRMSEINRFNLRVEERLRPNFEDGHFVGKYLTLLSEGTVAFLKGPHYYYRKRENASSTTDQAWLSVDKYLTIPKYGYLDLLKFSADRNGGRVPRNIQNMILNDLCWYFKYLTGRPERDILANDPSSEKQFLDTLSEIFTFFDEDALFDLPSRHLSFSYKFGVNNLFQHAEPPFYLSAVRGIDLNSSELLVESFSPDIVFYLDGKPVEPRCTKRADRYFCGRVFYSKYLQWIPFSDNATVLSYRLPNGKEVRLSARGTHFRDSVPINKLMAKLKADWGKYEQREDSWIIMDRDTQADDNGEHFYRYMAANHPEQKCFFALRKDSPNWSRLAEEGFDLLPFGTPEYEKELKACSKIISSHADTYVHSYFGDNFLMSKEYIFLQHGITKDNISMWLNDKPISLLIAATPQEYAAFVEDGSPYEFTKKQVVRTGFPRHDNLLQLAAHTDRSEKVILIAPTWRGSLTGAVKGLGNQRELNDKFGESEYAQAWESFLRSEELHRFAEDSDSKVVFFPHANILPYLEAGVFKVPDYIEIGSTEKQSIQNYLAKASVCITDYSSVAFDVAYLGIPCIYYQFDKGQVFNGGHIYSRGYFDYVKDGFGPVAETEEDLHKALALIADNNFKPTSEYQARIDATFDLRDGKCCERVYQAITRKGEWDGR